MGDRTYREAGRYLRRRLAALEACSLAARALKDAYRDLVTFDPRAAIAGLEEAQALMEGALEDARALANMDDAAPLRRDPAA